MDKFTFIIPKDSGGWWLVITEPWQLAAYWETRQGFDSEVLWEDDENKSEAAKKYFETAKIKAGLYGTSILQAYSDIKLELINAQSNRLCKKGAIFINDAGGWNFVFNVNDTEAKVEKDSIVWPKLGKSDIKISKWGAGGQHFYGRIGSIDVFDFKNQVQKWNTYDECYAFAMRMLGEVAENG